jgi:hypothetical protein
VFQGLVSKADMKVSHRLVTVPFTRELCGNSCHAMDKSVIFLMASFRIFLANMQYISLLALKPFRWKFVILVLMLHETFSMIISADGAH